MDIIEASGASVMGSNPIEHESLLELKNFPLGTKTNPFCYTY